MPAYHPSAWGFCAICATVYKNRDNIRVCYLAMVSAPVRLRFATCRLQIPLHVGVFMALLPILVYPDPKLHTVACAVGPLASANATSKIAKHENPWPLTGWSSTRSSTLANLTTRTLLPPTRNSALKFSPFCIELLKATGRPRAPNGKGRRAPRRSRSNSNSWTTRSSCRMNSRHPHTGRTPCTASRSYRS